MNRDQGYNLPPILYGTISCSLIKTRPRLTENVTTDEGIRMGSESSAKLSNRTNSTSKRTAMANGKKRRNYVLHKMIHCD